MFKLTRNGKIVRHIIMVGPVNHNFKTSKVIDLEFETLKAANEVAEVLKADVIDVTFFVNSAA